MYVGPIPSKCTSGLGQQDDHQNQREAQYAGAKNDGANQVPTLTPIGQFVIEAGHAIGQAHSQNQHDQRQEDIDQRHHAVFARGNQACVDRDQQEADHLRKGGPQHVDQRMTADGADLLPQGSIPQRRSVLGRRRTGFRFGDRRSAFDHGRRCRFRHAAFAPRFIRRPAVATVRKTLQSAATWQAS